jgi:hypothetical protein
MGKIIDARKKQAPQSTRSVPRQVYLEPDVPGVTDEKEPR